MAARSKRDRQAYGTVCLIDKTYAGRVRFTAVLLEIGTSIEATFPAEGCDPINYIIGQDPECLDTVAKLRAWTADHFKEIEEATGAARARRFALRREHLSPANDGR